MLWRIDLGYGLYFGEHNWVISEVSSSSSTLMQISSDKYQSIGLTFSLYYHILGPLYGGVVYEPQIFAVEDGVHRRYEYLVNFGIQLRNVSRVEASPQDGDE